MAEAAGAGAGAGAEEEDAPRQRTRCGGYNRMHSRRQHPPSMSFHRLILDIDDLTHDLCSGCISR